MSVFLEGLFEGDSVLYVKFDTILVDLQKRCIYIMYLTHALHRSVFGRDIWNVRETNTVFFDLLFYFNYVLFQINSTYNPGHNILEL